MCKISLAAVGLVLMLGSISHGAQPMSYDGYQIIGEVWSAPPPSGLRFSGTQGLSIRTADMGGGGMGAPCMGCGGGTCVHWTLTTWYGPWPDDGMTYGHGHGRCCRQPKCGGCGY